eukprot:COSAG01_NODE_1043_length_11954_cov_9.077014_8_plen_123_part_00
MLPLACSALLPLAPWGYLGFALSACGMTSAGACVRACIVVGSQDDEENSWLEFTVGGPNLIVSENMAQWKMKAGEGPGQVCAARAEPRGSVHWVAVPRRLRPLLSRRRCRRRRCCRCCCCDS